MNPALSKTLHTHLTRVEPKSEDKFGAPCLAHFSDVSG
jgi:hypothetical protein